LEERRREIGKAIEGGVRRDFSAFWRQIKSI